MERRQLLLLTEDGSNTIYIPELNETYHSSHGAIQEAIHVFIEHGLKNDSSNDLHVFEMGFGTGLNALLTGIEASNNQQRIHYTGIEAYPVAKELALQMDYCSKLGNQHQALFEQLHSTNWNEIIPLNEWFTFEKIHQKIEDYAIKENSVDIIYYDAFGPRAQGEMWHPSILKKMYNLLRPNGFLVTYCAKGQVKRDLKSLGFELEALPGPPGKREMTRAWKKN